MYPVVYAEVRSNKSHVTAHCRFFWCVKNLNNMTLDIKTFDILHDENCVGLKDTIFLESYSLVITVVAA